MATYGYHTVAAHHDADQALVEGAVGAQHSAKATLAYLRHARIRARHGGGGEQRVYDYELPVTALNLTAHCAPA